MDCFELYIEPEKINPKNGQFRKGHIPFNKGKKQSEWMDGRKIRKIKKYLEIGRKLGNKDLPGNNKIEIVGIKDGKLTAFKSSIDAERILRAEGIMINHRNIRTVCKGIRKKAGGHQWFYSKDIEKYKNLIK
jgi:hypothetical protein